MASSLNLPVVLKLVPITHIVCVNFNKDFNSLYGKVNKSANAHVNCSNTANMYNIDGKVVALLTDDTAKNYTVDR
jgi:hypothetical protein